MQDFVDVYPSFLTDFLNFWSLEGGAMCLTCVASISWRLLCFLPVCVEHMYVGKQLNLVHHFLVQVSIQRYQTPGLPAFAHFTFRRGTTALEAALQNKASLGFHSLMSTCSVLVSVRNLPGAASRGLDLEGLRLRFHAGWFGFYTPHHCDGANASNWKGACVSHAAHTPLALDPLWMVWVTVRTVHNAQFAKSSGLCHFPRCRRSLIRGHSHLGSLCFCVRLWHTAVLCMLWRKKNWCMKEFIFGVFFPFLWTVFSLPNKICILAINVSTDFAQKTP